MLKKLPLVVVVSALISGAALSAAIHKTQVFWTNPANTVAYQAMHAYEGQAIVRVAEALGKDAGLLPDGKCPSSCSAVELERAAARSARTGVERERSGDVVVRPARRQIGADPCLVRGVASGPDAPSTVCVLSGDVHHSYAAQVDLPGPGDDPDSAGFLGAAAAVHQLTCSPVHNVVDWFIQPGFRLGWSRTIARATRRWAARAGVPPLAVAWHKLTGPLFGNTVATLDLDGRHAAVTFLQPRSAGTMTEVARLVLTDGPRAGSATEGAVVTGTSSTGRPRSE